MRRYLSVDRTACTGCRACEYVCSLHHTGAFNPAQSRIRVYRSGCLDFATLVCKHCPNPICIKVCPEEAITKIDGLVQVDPTLCTGCGICVEACRMMFMDEKENKAVTCDLCGACISECPEEALKIENLGENR